MRQPRGWLLDDVGICYPDQWRAHRTAMDPSAPDDRQPTPSESKAVMRSRASEAIWKVLDGTSSTDGTDFFAALVQQLAHALDVSHAFVAECTDRTRTRVRTLAFWSRDRLVDNIEFDVAG